MTSTLALRSPAGGPTVHRRRTTRALAVLWTAAALGVTVVSLAGPLASAATVAAGLVLAGLHLLVAAVLVPAMRRSSAPRS